MQQILNENWWLVVIALLIGVLVAWWIFSSTRKTQVTREATDADAAAPAKRNQALIDAPPAVQPPPVTPVGLAGAGTAVAAAVDDTAKAATEPEPDLAPSAAPAARAKVDDLKRIKGVGPKLETTLRALGVTSYAQIAAWDDAEIDRIDAQLGRFEGRIRRDEWVMQAKLLAAGDEAAFASRFGNS